MQRLAILSPQFNVEYDYVPLADNELTLNVGDIVNVLVMDDDHWWYGTTDAGQHGWFPASYGRCDSEFTDQITSDLKYVFRKMVASEENFSNSLNSFISTIVKPLEIRDTPFKRSLMSECSLALSFNLMSELLAGSLSLLNALKCIDINSSDLNDLCESLATCITHFAPTLRLFSQYIAENSNALNSLKAHASGLRRFLRDYSLPDTSLELYLKMPGAHFGHYMLDVDDIIFYINLLMRSKPGYAICGVMLMDLLREAGEILRVYAEEADQKLKEERKKQILLSIQNQFINYPKLYAPNREFIREADLDILTPSSGYCEDCHVHLLSDAVIVSTRVRGMPGMFKFEQALDLSVVVLERVVDPLISVNSFALSIPQEAVVGEDVDVVLVFRCHGPKDLKSWIESIETQQSLLMAAGAEASLAKNTRRGSIMLRAKRSSQHFHRSGKSGGAGTSETIPQSPIARKTSGSNDSQLYIEDRVDIDQLLTASCDAKAIPPGVTLMLQFLKKESAIEKDLHLFRQVVVDPLIDASKGAELVVGLTDEEKDMEERSRGSSNASTATTSSGRVYRRASTSELFARRGSYTDVIGGISSRFQAKSVSDAISDSDLHIFLRSVENVVVTLMEFLLLIEMSLVDGQFDDDLIAIGSVCMSPQAELLYQQLKSYAGGYQAAIRVLNSPALSKFKARADQKLSGLLKASVKMENLIVLTLEFPRRLKACLIQLHSHTSDQRIHITRALRNLQTVEEKMENIVLEKKNFEALISIRDCFFLSQDPVLAALVSNDRKLIREGDLVKVCRKADKVFRFWLFNDYLIYGEPIGGGRYKWSRALDMSTCRAKRRGDNGAETSRSFEIHAAKKSFVVLAATREDRERWVRDLEAVSQALKPRSTSSSILQSDVLTAPLWVPDSVGKECCVCKEVLGSVFNRKHHCRMCGNVVCGEHSQQRIMLPHIDKRTAQRVCDTCLSRPVPQLLYDASKEDCRGVYADKVDNGEPGDSSDSDDSTGLKGLQSHDVVSNEAEMLSSESDVLEAGDTAHPPPPRRPSSLSTAPTPPPKPPRIITRALTSATLSPILSEPDKPITESSPLPPQIRYEGEVQNSCAVKFTTSSSIGSFVSVDNSEPGDSSDSDDSTGLKGLQSHEVVSNEAEMLSSESDVLEAGDTAHPPPPRRPSSLSTAPTPPPKPPRIITRALTSATLSPILSEPDKLITESSPLPPQIPPRKPPKNTKSLQNIMTTQVNPFEVDPWILAVEAEKANDPIPRACIQTEDNIRQSIKIDNLTFAASDEDHTERSEPNVFLRHVRDTGKYHSSEDESDCSNEEESF